MMVLKKWIHSCLRALESASLTHPPKMILTSTCIQILYFLQMSAIAMSGSNAPYTVVPAVALTRKGTNPYKKAQRHLAKSDSSSPNSSCAAGAGTALMAACTMSPQVAPRGHSCYITGFLVNLDTSDITVSTLRWQQTSKPVSYLFKMQEMGKGSKEQFCSVTYPKQKGLLHGMSCKANLLHKAPQCPRTISWTPAAKCCASLRSTQSPGFCTLMPWVCRNLHQCFVFNSFSVDFINNTQSNKGGECLHLFAELGLKQSEVSGLHYAKGNAAPGDLDGALLPNQLAVSGWWFFTFVFVLLGEAEMWVNLIVTYFLFGLKNSSFKVWWNHFPSGKRRVLLEIWSWNHLLLLLLHLMVNPKRNKATFLPMAYEALKSSDRLCPLVYTFSLLTFSTDLHQHGDGNTDTISQSPPVKDWGRPTEHPSPVGCCSPRNCSQPQARGSAQAPKMLPGCQTPLSRHKKMLAELHSPSTATAPV